jgi:hypothetical protein
MFSKKKDNEGLLKGVWMAYSILALHVLLIAAMGCLVLFFSGIIQYMIWIFLGSSLFVGLSGYRFYHRMKEEKRSLHEMMDSPLFRGKSLEISLLGGLASIKVGMPSSHPMLPMSEPVMAHPAAVPFPRLTDPTTARLRELSELARLYENHLITLDEYSRLKEQIFHHTIDL